MMTPSAVHLAEYIAEVIVYQYGTNCELDKIRTLVDANLQHDSNFKAIDLAGIYEYIAMLTASAEVSVTIKPIEFYSKVAK